MVVIFLGVGIQIPSKFYSNQFRKLQKCSDPIFIKDNLCTCQHLDFLSFVLFRSSLCVCENYAALWSKNLEFIYLYYISVENPICCLVWLLHLSWRCFFHQFFNIAFFNMRIKSASEIAGKKKKRKISRNVKRVAFCSGCTWMQRAGHSVTLVWEPHPVQQPALRWALQWGKQLDALCAHWASPDPSADDDARKEWPCSCLVWDPVPRHLLI